MNRLEFIGQTYQGKPISVDDVIRFFDHTMAAYEVIGNTDSISVTGTTNHMQSSLKLQLISSDLAKLHEIVTYINETIHNRKNLYGRSFKIDASVDGNLVELFVREDYSY